MSFFQVRQHGAPSLKDLDVLIQRAVGSCCPGTVLDHSLNSLHGSMPGFFLSRAGGSEVIWARAFPAPLTGEVLESLRAEYQSLKSSVLDFRPRVESFLSFIFAPSFGAGFSKPLSSFGPEWSFYEYFFLQAEGGEGLALRKWEHAAVPELKVEPQRMEISKPGSGEPVTLEQYARLTPEELNALIDLSLALELRAHDQDAPPHA